MGAADRDRSLPHAHRGRRRLAYRDSSRHGCGAGAGHDARDSERGPGRSRLHCRDDARLRALAERVREYTPERVAAWTGMTPGEIEQLAREYATTRPAALRLNYGVQRCENGGAAVRAIAMLPALTGAWKTRGGGGQLSTSGAFAWDKKALERPDLALASPIGRLARVVNMSELGRALTELGQARDQGTANRNRGTRPTTGRRCMRCLCTTRIRERLRRITTRCGGTGARRSIYGGARAVLYRHHRLCRLCAAGDDVSGAHRRAGSVRALLRAAFAAGD
jgi:hypothetical protein